MSDHHNRLTPDHRARLKHKQYWIFDLDNTLYPAKSDLFSQIDQRMGHFVERRFNLDPAAAKKLQKSLFHRHGTTLRGLMIEHDLPPREYLDFVHDIDLSPIAPNRRLEQALGHLPGQLFVFTNGTMAHAERILERLGIARRFTAIFDIVAADYVPKPAPETYETLVARHGINPAASVMVEDMAVNLKPARDMGMSTVLVPGRKEWSPGHDRHDHVEYYAEDLTIWLEAVVEG